MPEVKGTEKERKEGRKEAAKIMRKQLKLNF